MADQLFATESPPEPERLSRIEVFFEILSGIGIALGLSLLWLLEVIRDATFRILDHANIRPRVRRASAFPPGQPRRHSPRRAR
jgi:hypothetical protein